MRPLGFLACCTIGFLFLGAAYALIIDRVVIPERTVPFPYTEFLLESSRDINPKVVIDSGSNSLHGIDTSLLSNYFHAPVIIVADGASYPLRNKIFRLKKYLGRGDVLILPLEWNYYRRPDALATSFLSLIADEHLSLEFYFNELPVVEKLRFIFTKYPLKIALASLELRDSEKISRTDLYRLIEFEEILKAGNNKSFGSSVEDGPIAIDPGAASLKCEAYTGLNLGRVSLGKDYISSVFRSDLNLLQNLAKSGVTIYFTWPSIVDSETSACFKRPGKLQKIRQFSIDITELVENHGFKFIGEFKDSHFSSACFLDTYYHLRYSCSKDRTTRLIAALKRDKVAPIESPYTQADLINSAINVAEQTKKRLLD